MHTKLAITLCLIVTILLSGCNGYVETDQVAWVTGIGVDKASHPGMIAVTYQIAAPLGGVDGQSGDMQSASEPAKKPPTTLVTIIAPSLAEARNLLNSAISLRPNLYHAKMIIIGEDLAREGLGDFVGPLTRYREFRGSMFIAVAKGSARDVLANIDPGPGIEAPRFYELMLDSAHESSYYLHTSLHTFYSHLKSPSSEAYATYVGVNPRTKTSEMPHTGVPGDKTHPYVPSELPRQGGNPVDFLGTALFNKDKMVGILSNKETRMLSILLNDFPRGFITVEDPLLPGKKVNIQIRNGRSPKVSVDLSKDIASVHIDLLIEAEITSIASGINYEEKAYRVLLEQHITNIVGYQMREMLRYTQEARSDAAGIGYFARRHFQTRDELTSYNWKEKYPTANISLDIKTIVRRSGLMWRTNPFI